MKNSKTLKILVIIILVAWVVGGCSIKSNLDEMHDKTMQMAQTTENMATTTDKLNNTTESTYYGLRTVETRNIRQSNFLVVLDHPDMPTKINLATTYFYGLEFQHWKDIGPDDAKRLEDLKSLAVIEFFEFIQEFLTPEKYFWENFEPLSPHLLSFYAFAATMHRILPDQATLAKAKGFPPNSMYSVISDALEELARNPRRDPKTMPLWMYYVQHFYPIAIDLLRARYTYLPFQVYAELVDLNKMTKFQAWQESSKDQKIWRVDLYNRNLSQIARHTEFMQHALKTRRLLLDLGVPVELDDTETKSLKIKTIFRHLDYGNPSQTYELQEKEIAKFKYVVSLLLLPAKDFGTVDPETYLP